MSADEWMREEEEETVCLSVCLSEGTRTLHAERRKGAGGWESGLVRGCGIKTSSVRMLKRRIEPSLCDSGRVHVQAQMILAAPQHHRYDLILNAARLEKEHMATAITV